VLAHRVTAKRRTRQAGAFSQSSPFAHPQFHITMASTISHNSGVCSPVLAHTVTAIRRTRQAGAFSQSSPFAHPQSHTTMASTISHNSGVCSLVLAHRVTAKRWTVCRCLPWWTAQKQGSANLSLDFLASLVVHSSRPSHRRVKFGWAREGLVNLFQL